MKHSWITGVVILGSMILCLETSGGADDLNRILREIYPLAAPTGHEEALVGKIESLLPEGFDVEKDNLGTIYASGGKGKERLTIFCGVDEVGFIVSGITPQGYLNLDRIVPAAHPVYDAFPFGHALVIWTEQGPVLGVLALPSIHIFPRERRNELPSLFSLENSFVDIGASSARDVESRGIALLDPVTPETKIIPLTSGLIAGHNLGGKTCSAILLNTAGSVEIGRLQRNTTFVWAAQTKFLRRGSRPGAALGALRVHLTRPPSHVIVIDTFPCEKYPASGISIGKGAILALPDALEDKGLAEELNTAAEGLGLAVQTLSKTESSLMVPFLQSEKPVVGLFLPVKFAATPSEVVDPGDAEGMVRLLSQVLQGRRER